MENQETRIASFDTLRVSRLETVDRNGVVRAQLGTDVKEAGDGTEASCLRLLREDGTVAADLGFFRDRGFEEPLLNFYGREGYARITIPIHPFEQFPSISILDSDAVGGVSLSVSPDDDPSIVIVDDVKKSLWVAPDRDRA